MAQARKKLLRKQDSRKSGFRRSAVMEEQFSKARLEHFRMMLLRGEHDSVIWHVRNESKGNITYLEKLLEDDYVGVAPSAADMLMRLVKRKIDIGRAVPALEKALGNQYTKMNAARALAAYHLKEVNIRRLEELLTHKDPDISEAAQEIVNAERYQEFRTD